MYAEPAGRQPAGAGPNSEPDTDLPFLLAEPLDIPGGDPDHHTFGEPWLRGSPPGWTRPELTGLKLTERHLVGVDLRGATMLRTRISRVDLSHRDLTGADLRSARGTNALLAHAILRDADLAWADLREADLSHADLTGANLMEVNLARADLRGCRLAGARHLELACLRNALADTATIWPGSFDPVAAGVVSCSSDRRVPDRG